jgi:hypothetical protein
MRLAAERELDHETSGQGDRNSVLLNVNTDVSE